MTQGTSSCIAYEAHLIRLQNHCVQTEQNTSCLLSLIKQLLEYWFYWSTACYRVVKLLFSAVMLRGLCRWETQLGAPGAYLPTLHLYLVLPLPPALNRAISLPSWDSLNSMHCLFQFSITPSANWSEFFNYSQAVPTLTRCLIRPKNSVLCW